MRILATGLFMAAFLACLGCSDGGGGGQDASDSRVCTPGHLRCDPEGRPWIQQCNDDGTAWEDHVRCVGLCHEGICYPPLDAGSG
jgi:hypothetical protein